MRVLAHPFQPSSPERFFPYLFLLFALSSSLGHVPSNAQKLSTSEISSALIGIVVAIDEVSEVSSSDTVMNVAGCSILIGCNNYYGVNAKQKKSEQCTNANVMV